MRGVVHHVVAEVAQHSPAHNDRRRRRVHAEGPRDDKLDEPGNHLSRPKGEVLEAR